MFLALNMLGYKADRRIRFVATDGSFLYYNPVLLIENYKKNPTDVNRAYLHMIMHCLFRHIYDAEKYKDEDDIQLRNLSCDICAEYLVDGIELSCVIKPENTKRQQIYKEILDKSRVLSAANIFYILKTQMKIRHRCGLHQGSLKLTTMHTGMQTRAIKITQAPMKIIISRKKSGRMLQRRCSRQ